MRKVIVGKFMKKAILRLILFAALTPIVSAQSSVKIPPIEERCGRTSEIVDHLNVERAAGKPQEEAVTTVTVDFDTLWHRGYPEWYKSTTTQMAKRVYGHKGYRSYYRYPACVR